MLGFGMFYRLSLWILWDIVDGLTAKAAKAKILVTAAAAVLTFTWLYWRIRISFVAFAEVEANRFLLRLGSKTLLQ